MIVRVAAVLVAKRICGSEARGRSVGALIRVSRWLVRLTARRVIIVAVLIVTRHLRRSVFALTTVKIVSAQLFPCLLQVAQVVDNVGRSEMWASKHSPLLLSLPSREESKAVPEVVESITCAACAIS